jgi:COP9 signalosome complex subunit 1
MASTKPHVQGTPRLELESYINNYDPQLRIARLVAIAKADSILSHEALRLAIVESKKGQDTQMYKKLVTVLRSNDTEDDLSTLDTAWIDKTDREVKSRTDQLEAELKQYKNNLIKESIRVSTT